MDASQPNDTPATPEAHGSQGRQTPPPEPAHHQLNSQNSPVFPKRNRSNSAARKRNNEEAYEPADTPQESPRHSKHLRRASTMTTVTEAETQRDRTNPFSPVKANDQGKAVPSDVKSDAHQAPATGTFVSQVEDYQRELEEDFQKFERQLNDRDTSAELEQIDWTDLEADYNKDIEPLLQQENAIMQEFGDRFNVGIATAPQFPD
jgi:hypothetical protein